VYREEGGRIEAAVVSRRRIDVACDGLQPQLVRHVPAELRMERRVVGAIVVAQRGIGALRIEAVGLEIGHRDVEVAAIVAAGQTAAELPRGKLAALDGEAAPEAVGSPAGDDADDPARVGAVHESLRPAQHLDAFHVGGAEHAFEARRRLRRARIDGLDAVDQQHRPVALFAANPQRGRLAGSAAIADADAGLGAQQVRNTVEAA
jgi:hypothetical protein